MTEWWRKITWKEWEADLLWLCGKEKASEIGLTSLVLSFREEEEKDVRDSKVRPEGQVDIMGFRGKEVWAGSKGCGLNLLQNQ